MRKILFVTALAVCLLVSGCATITKSLRSDLPFPAEHKELVSMDLANKTEYDILGPTEGISTGFRFVPIFPLINSELIPSLVAISPSAFDAYKQAMSQKGADFLTDVHIEKTTTNILLIFCLDRVAVWGQAAKLKTAKR
jgi:hypothetical protein